MWSYNYDNELYHHGDKGMKWGVRRYQNNDGTMTPQGKKRYSDKSPYEVTTVDGDTFRITGRSANKKYDPKKAKVTKTYGEHLYEKDNEKIHKKAEKKYVKNIEKTKRQLVNQQNHMAYTSYNKAADILNDGGIEKFNKQQQKKYGNDYAQREKYVDDYKKLFKRTYDKMYNKTLSDFYDSNKSYKKAQKIVDEYGMMTWSDLATKNKNYVDSIRKKAR